MVQAFGDGGGSDRRAIGLNEIMDNGDYITKGTNYITNYKAQVVNKVMLLESLAKSTGRPSSNVFPPTRHKLKENIPGRLGRVVKSIKLWPQLIATLKSSLRNLHQTEELTFSGALPAVQTPQQASHMHGVHLIQRATDALKQASRLGVEANVQAMGFMLKWQATVSPRILHTTSFKPA